MADYTSANSDSKTPLVLGVAAVVVVVVLGLVAFGVGGGEIDLSPTTELGAPAATDTVPTVDWSAAPVIE